MRNLFIVFIGVSAFIRIFIKYKTEKDKMTAYDYLLMGISALIITIGIVSLIKNIPW